MGLNFGGRHARLIKRLKAKRLDFKPLFRSEDNTVAFYLPGEGPDGVIALFLDVWARDSYTWFKRCKRCRISNVDLETFLCCMWTKSFLHEMQHWCDDNITDTQAERQAIICAFGMNFLQKLTSRFGNVIEEEEDNEEGGASDEELKKEFSDITSSLGEEE